MSEYDRIRYYNILENYKILHSLGKSAHTSQILIQLIQSYSKIYMFNGLYFVTYY